MLTELVVENLGVIDATELNLERGCSALTGETGAGKTLVVAALGLLLGGRADRTLVRTGATEARVEGRFAVPKHHPVADLLRSNGVVEEGDEDLTEIVIARTVSADGRGRARINGRLVTAALLAAAGAHLVEIAGQNEHQRIAVGQVQRRLLDAYAGVDTVAEEVAAAVRAAADAGRKVTSLRADERVRLRDLESLRDEVAEIEEAALEIGEADALSVEAVRLEHSELIAAAVARAREGIAGERGAQELLSDAGRDLGTVTEHDPALGQLGDRIEAAGYEAADIAHELAAYVVAVDPDALEAARGRLAVLARLRRKYGDDEREILMYLERARARLAALEEPDVDAEHWARRGDEARRRAEVGAEHLSAARRAARARLERDMDELLADLALGDARFEVRLEPRSLYEGGAESVEFYVATDPGQDARPLAKVASGGELARIALALHLATAAGGAETMVFDEVDAGVGGRAAQAVGRCLARLARTTGGQVLVVTHLPQVAAFADAHLRVVKTSGGARSSASVGKVEGDDRIAELSRMLAGLPDSERARGHAKELLELRATR
ncbi:MAG: DNA repair protein RecN [Actinomycetota bacterium]